MWVRKRCGRKRFSVVAATPSFNFLFCFFFFCFCVPDRLATGVLRWAPVVLGSARMRGWGLEKQSNFSSGFAEGYCVLGLANCKGWALEKTYLFFPGGSARRPLCGLNGWECEFVKIDSESIIERSSFLRASRQYV